MFQAMKPQAICSRRSRFVAALILPGMLAAGCSTMSNTEKGVGAGGLIGAGTGAVVGNAVGRPGAGALIGAGVGALSGGLIGNAIDESERKTEAKVAAAQQSRGPLGLTDVVQLVQQHVSDDVIIGQIRTTGSVFYLSTQDLLWLKQNGVSDPVIREMQATVLRGPRRVYSAAPVYGPPVYVVDPAPVSVGFGVGYTHFGRGRW